MAIILMVAPVTFSGSKRGNWALHVPKFCSEDM